MGITTKERGIIPAVVFVVVCCFLTTQAADVFAMGSRGYDGLKQIVKRHLPPGLGKRVRLDKPVLIAPEGEIATRRPLYQWRPVEGAIQYGLIVHRVTPPRIPVYIKFGIRETQQRHPWWRRLKYNTDYFFVVIGYNKRTRKISPLSGKKYFGVVREIPNQEPVALFTAAPGFGTAPLTVNFDASGSHDPDGTIASYQWDFDGDGTFDGQGVNAGYTYTVANTYTVKLRVSDNRGAFSETTGQIAVEHSLPTVSISANPDAFALGETSILSWRSADADSCVIEPGIGSVGPTGSIAVTPTETTTYTITATGPGGTSTAGVSVRVTLPDPTVSLTASPERIQIAERATLFWGSENADFCLIEPRIGRVDIRGFMAVSPTETITYTVTATGPGGTATASATITVTMPPPIVDILAVPETIQVGESSILTWSSIYADTGVIEPGIGSVDITGSITVSPTETTTYTITAMGPGGTATEIVTVSVIPPPAVSMSVSADTIDFGESCTMSWDSTHASTFSIEPEIGSVEASGSLTISPEDSITYTITATGPGGTATASVTVTVIHPLPAVSMSVSADTIDFGESCTLSWDSLHTVGCAIEPGMGSVDASGSLAISPEDSITYTITATGPGGMATANVTVTVIPPVPLVSLSADPGTVYSGRSAALSWQAIHAASCVIEPGIGSVDAEGYVRVWPTETTTYTITATGPGGFATATTTVAITSTQSDPPVIDINDPLDMAVVDTDTVAISGTVTPADAEVWVNGIPADVVNGNFTSVNIPLKSGANAIIATASHSRVTGNDKVWVVRAYEYQPQPEGSFGKRYEDLVPPDAVVASYEAKRFAVVTGQVLLTDGSPLADVSITIYGHPEYGTTYSDQEGRFSIPLEGGKTFTISFVRSGLLTVHRQVYVPVNDTAVCETVRMTAQDTRSTLVTFDGNAETHITHQSSEISDEFGSRSCTLVFSGDNRAYAMDEKGQVMEELASVTTRATTYTTPESMPARLPPNSAYTYCVELSVDGAERIEFEKPVVVWVDNYLGFDVGEIVPVGSYDKDRGVWIPSDNGVVVLLLDTDNDGIVDALDANGDDQPDDMDEDGSFSSEVEGLEERVRYAPDSTFWRVEVTHFTAWDFNWPWNRPGDATYPSRNSTSFADLQPVKSKSCIRRNSSFVEERSRVFHEDIPIPGIDVFLHYTSSRVKGYKTVITIPASGETVPPSLSRIVVKIELAGRTFEQYLPALPYQMAEFVWDGLDHLGRAVNGPAMAHVGVGFAYDAYYTSAGTDGSRTFGQPGGSSTGIRAQREVVLWNREDMYLPKGQGVIAEGWTLSPHHQMSLIDLSTLYKGDGAILSNNAHIESELKGYSGAYPTDVEVDEGGNLYIVDLGSVWKLDPNSNSTPVVPIATGDPDIDSPSPTARFNNPEGVAMDTEGNLYISDSYNHRIRKVDTSGIVTTVAGCGPTGFMNGGFSGDGGPATQARLDNPAGIAVDTWGNMYFSDYYNYRIRKIDVNGIITTVAGGGEQRVDGVPATESRLSFPTGIDVDAAGNLYFIENSGLRKVDTSGIISTLIRVGESPYANDVAVDAAGNIYVSELRYMGRIRKINTSGFVSNFPNAGSRFEKPSGLAVDSQGNLYVSLYELHKVYKIAPPFVFFGAMSPGDIAFAEESGIGHILSSSGLHERTIDLNTGVVLREFDYDEDNRLTAVTDQSGNQIIIGRDADGEPTTITSPEGLNTALTIDADNHLTRITYPDSSYYSFEYSSEGLLTVKTEPEGNRFAHQFDALGRLTDATDDEGGQWSYSRSTEGNGDITTQVLTAEGNLTTYLDHTDTAGIYTSTITGPTGAETLFTQSVDGLSANKSLPCGMELEFEYGIDSEFKFKHVKKMTETTPSGLARITENAKTYQDTDLDLTPDRITETVAVNGKTSTIVNDTNESRKTITSPEGRTVIIDYDPDTLLTASVESAGLYETTYEYDAKGRLTSTITHTRTSILAYNEQGFLETLTDAGGHTTTYSYDEVGRMITIDRPDGSIVGFDYDQNGNMIILTNPAAIAHGFDFNGVNLNSSYETPLSGTYSYAYDKDRRLIRTTFPSARQIRNVYDTSRLVQIQTPEGDIDFTYLCGTKVESVVKGAEKITYEYDGSLVTSEVLSGTINQTLVYSYDDDFNVIGFTYGGSTDNYAYDNDGLLIGAGDYDITRNAENGLPESVTDGPLNSSRSFNGYGELDGQDVTVSGNSITSWNLARDNSGRIIAKTEVVAGITSAYDYTYDSLGRLLTVLKDGMLVEEYQYNANGTRTYEMNSLRGITGRSYAYSDEDHLLTAGAVTYQYDLDGFLTIKTVGTETTNYTYSSRGELLDVTLPDGTFIEYVHDSLGRRIAKKINGTITEKYLWQGLTRLIAVYDGTDNLLMRFEYADARMPVTMEKEGTKYYLTYDQVGSLRVVADASGNVVKSIEYDSFGNIISDSNHSFDVSFGFAGGLHDRDTGLVRFGYRDYDPDIGRWTAKDPIIFEGGDTDLYGYCLNDPVNWMDPWGLWTYPTTGPIRGADKWGSGAYRASRDGGRRKHAGTDYSGAAGENVVAPMGGTLEIINGGVRITGRVDSEIYSTIVLHINVTASEGKIEEGDIIGTIEDITSLYPGITNHAHVEIYSIKNGRTTRLNPKDYIPEYAPCH